MAKVMPFGKEILPDGGGFLPAGAFEFRFRCIREPVRGRLFYFPELVEPIQIRFVVGDDSVIAVILVATVVRRRDATGTVCRGRRQPRSQS